MVVLFLLIEMSKDRQFEELKEKILLLSAEDADKVRWSISIASRNGRDYIKAGRNAIEKIIEGQEWKT